MVYREEQRKMYRYTERERFLMRQRTSVLRLIYRRMPRRENISSYLVELPDTKPLTIYILFLNPQRTVSQYGINHYLSCGILIFKANFDVPNNPNLNDLPITINKGILMTKKCVVVKSTLT